VEPGTGRDQGKPNGGIAEKLEFGKTDTNAGGRIKPERTKGKEVYKVRSHSQTGEGKEKRGKREKRGRKGRKPQYREKER